MATRTEVAGRCQEALQTRLAQTDSEASEALANILAAAGDHLSAWDRLYAQLRIEQECIEE